MEELLNIDRSEFLNGAIAPSVGEEVGSAFGDHFAIGPNHERFRVLSSSA